MTNKDDFDSVKCGGSSTEHIATEKIIFPFAYSASSNLKVALDYVNDYCHDLIDGAFDAPLFRSEYAFQHIHESAALNNITESFRDASCDSVQTSTFRLFDYSKQQTAHGFKLASLPGFKQAFTVDSESNQIRIFTDDESPDSSKHLMRALREVHLRSCENLGAVLLHAASVEIDRDECWLIVGEKGAGKSSLLLWLLLSNSRNKLISNDRTFLWAPGKLQSNNENWWGSFFPMAALLGPGLLQATLGQDWIQKTSTITRKQDQPIEMIAKKTDEEGPSTHFTRKVMLSSADYSHLYSRANKAYSQVKGILFPRLIHDDEQDFEFSSIDKETAFAKLIAQCYTPIDPAFGSGWLIESTEASSELKRSQAHSRIANLLDQVPAVSVSFGYKPSLREDLRDEIKRILEAARL